MRSFKKNCNFFQNRRNAFWWKTGFENKVSSKHPMNLKVCKDSTLDSKVYYYPQSLELLHGRILFPTSIFPNIKVGRSQSSRHGKNLTSCKLWFIKTMDMYFMNVLGWQRKVQSTEPRMDDKLLYESEGTSSNTW